MAAEEAPTATSEGASSPGRRARRTQAERTAEARAALIDAAITAVHQKGYAGATTAVIAQEAGVSRALITHHFGSRAQLMADVISIVYEREHQEYQRIEAVEKRGGRIADWPEMLWEVLSKPSGLAVLEILQASRNDPDLARLVGSTQERIEARTLAMMQLRFGFADEEQTLAGLRMMIWAIRGLAIAQVLVTDSAEIERSVMFLRRLVEAAVSIGTLADRARLPASGPAS